MSTTVETGTAIRPFQVDFSAEQMDDVRRRVAATRRPSKELVGDRSQGVQLATAQALAEYWSGEYDFGRIEERLNALPQFVTEIDGVDIHFIHVRSQHEDALPLIMTHGWPGSVIEMIDSVGALTGPMPTDTDEERAASAQIATFGQSGNGYFVEMASRPQTIGYALLDSPNALAAWMIDHDTDSYYKIAGAFLEDKPSGNLTRD